MVASFIVNSRVFCSGGFEVLKVAWMKLFLGCYAVSAGSYRRSEERNVLIFVDR